MAPAKRRRGAQIIKVNPQRPSETANPILTDFPANPSEHTLRGFVAHVPKTAPATAGANQPRRECTTAPSTTRGNYARIRWVDASPVDSMDSQGYRPPKLRRIKTSKCQRFSVRKPVKNSAAIHEDVWRLVLSHSNPKLLLSMRYVCTLFRDMLKESGIWRSSRREFFGADMPDCPFFLTEAQYVDLLVGNGCQNGQCLRRETRKACWIFRGRLCDACLRRKTGTDCAGFNGTPSPVFPEIFEELRSTDFPALSYLDLMPTAYHEGGRYYAPRKINPNTGKWYNFGHRSQGLLYLKSDHQKLMDELNTIDSEAWETRRISQWAREKYDSALRLGKIAEELSQWETNNPGRSNQLVGRFNERERENFFIQKASQLPEPIPANLLGFFSAYQAALATSNQPSDRSWNLLLPKILPYRESAKKVSQYKLMQPHCHIRASESNWSEDAKLSKKLYDHRHLSHVETGRWTPEQEFVRQLGREEFAKVQDQVADEDLVLVCLRNVYDRYQGILNKPNGLNMDGTEGPYRLSLDDARMIVEDIIQPHMNRKTLRSVKVLRSFRCIGCTRPGVYRKYTFRSCFEHILTRHSVTVGKGLEFHMYARNFVSSGLSDYWRFSGRSVSGSNFPWYITPWTITLPILPLHAKITRQTVWDPYSDAPLVTRPVVDNEPETSIFFDRHVKFHGGREALDFHANFTHAVAEFDATQLDVWCVTRIALQYALDLYKTAASGLPPRAEFVRILKLAQGVNGSLAFKFQCGICSHLPDVNKHLRCAKTPVEITLLDMHWSRKHKEHEGGWDQKFLKLPTDSELQDSLEKHDEQLHQSQVQSLERETKGVQKTVRKKPDPKARILMAKKMCMDIFDDLFVPDAYFARGGDDDADDNDHGHDNDDYISIQRRHLRFW